MALTTVQNGMIGTVNSLTNAGGDVYGGLYGFRNRIINGAMNIWQRGTSFTSVANAGSTPQYTADRMFGYRGSGWAANLDVSQQTGFGQFQYCLRAQRTSGTSSTAVMVVGQIIESVNMYDLQGQSITLSFYCRAGSNFSGGTVSPQIYFSTAANQTSASLAVGTWTGQTVQSSTVTPTTTATQYTFTATVPSNALSMGVIFVWTPSGTAGANDYLDFAGVQLEKGSTATSFDYRPYGTELALCQRYFVQLLNPALKGIIDGGAAVANRMSCILPVTMRSAPSVSMSGTLWLYDGTNTRSSTSIAVAYSSSGNNTWEADLTPSSSMTAYRPCTTFYNSNTGYILASSEL